MRAKKEIEFVNLTTIMHIVIMMEETAATIGPPLLKNVEI